MPIPLPDGMRRRAGGRPATLAQLHIVPGTSTGGGQCPHRAREASSVRCPLADPLAGAAR